MIFIGMDLDKLSSQESKPAPGPLLAVQAFANTLDVEDGTDRLESPASLREWLVDGGLAASGIEIAAGDVEAARQLRDAIRTELDANGHDGARPAGSPPAPVATAAIPLRAAGDGPLGLDLDLEPAATVGVFLSQVLGITYRAQLLGEWQRLKLCECDECAWAFYDASRNRSGSWCRMEVCGNRIKNREYRRRHAGT